MQKRNFNTIWRRKAYSFATWTIVFAVVFAALAIIRAPLKRGIAKKVKGTTDYMLWGQVGQETRQHSRDATSISKGKTTAETTSTRSEEQGSFTTSIEAPESKTSRVTAGAGKGSESVLKILDDAYESVDLGDFHEGGLGE